MQTISIEQGLSQGFISGICQDSEGFMWFGTNSGLNRYDGYDFLIFKHDPYDPWSLSNNTISAVCEAGDFLCVITRGGIDLYHRRTQRFFRLPQQSGNFGHTAATLIAEGPNTLWAAFFETDAWRLYRLSWSEDFLAHLATGQKLEELVRFEPMFGELPLNGFDLSADKKTLWMTAEGGRLFRQPLPQGKLEEIPVPLSGLNKFSVMALGDRGVCIRDGLSKILACYQPDATTGQAWQLFPIGKIPIVNFLAFDDKRQLIWVATETEAWGLDAHKLTGQVNRAGARFVLSVPERALRGFTDRSGNLWICTNAKGIRKFNPQTGIFNNYADKHSVYCKPVADRAGNIWLGNLQTGQFNYRLSRSDGKLNLHPLPELTNNHYETRVAEDSTGALWFVGATADTLPPLLIRYAPTTGSHTVYRYPAPFQGLLPALYYDPDGHALWTAHARQLIRFDIAAGAFAGFGLDSLQLGRSWAFALTKTADGSLWLALENGLLRAEPRPGKHASSADAFRFRLLKNDPSDRNSLPGNSIKSLMTDPSDGHVLWIGTAGQGLSRYDLRTQHFRNYDTRNGLSDDVVYGILAEGPSPEGASLWLSTNKGLNRFNPATGAFRYFVKSDGLQDDEFNTFSYGKTRDGLLMFGGVNGLTVFDPKALRAGTTPARVWFSSLKINDQTTTPRDLTGVLREGIEYTAALTLPYHQNNLTLRFMADDLTQPERNQFSFYLEGAEKEWAHTGFDNRAQYLNLAPGNYIFKVKAANSDGVWNGTPTILKIRIRPPWYASIWAYLAYALLLGSGAYFFYRFQLDKKLEHAENERLKELDNVKTRLYTNITHEFRTPLTVILGMADQIKHYLAARSDAVLETSVEMIRRNGQQLLQLINQVLDLSKLESGNMRLHLVRGDVVAYLKYLVESFQSYAGGKNIRLHFEADPETLDMAYDREKLQAIVSNLLSNAIKFTPPDGTVSVQISTSATSSPPQFIIHQSSVIIIKVVDTGIGIPEEQLRHIFDRFYQVDNSATRTGAGTGIGLALVKELVKLMQGQIAVESRPGTGSVFTVTIPISDADAAVPADPAALPAAPVYVPLPDDAPAVPNNQTSDQPLALVVEDNADVRRYLIQCLQDQYRVLEAHHGQAGIELALEQIPDIIVSDVMMPEKDGFEVCDALKNDERTSHIPVVLLTARAAVEDRIAGLRRGADAYLTKPFHREELGVVLEQLLENRRRLRARYERGLPDNGTATAEAPDEIAIVEDAFLQKLRDIVEMHLSDAEFDMNRLSREVGMSHSQIFRKLKALTGRSPSTFIRTVRLNQARQLLQTTALTVAEIAYETGFTSPSYFSTVFLEEFGKTPTELR